VMMAVMMAAVPTRVAMMVTKAAMTLTKAAMTLAEVMMTPEVMTVAMMIPKDAPPFPERPAFLQ